MDKKPLESFTQEEFNKLRNSGKLLELYPEACQSYHATMHKLKSQKDD